MNERGQAIIASAQLLPFLLLQCLFDRAWDNILNWLVSACMSWSSQGLLWCPEYLMQLLIPCMEDTPHHLLTTKPWINHRDYNHCGFSLGMLRQMPLLKTYCIFGILCKPKEEHHCTSCPEVGWQLHQCVIMLWWSGTFRLWYPGVGLVAETSLGKEVIFSLPAMLYISTDLISTWITQASMYLRP